MWPSFVFKIQLRKFKNISKIFHENAALYHLYVRYCSLYIVFDCFVCGLCEIFQFYINLSLLLLCQLSTVITLLGIISNYVWYTLSTSVKYYICNCWLHEPNILGLIQQNWICLHNNTCFTTVWLVHTLRFQVCRTMYLL